MFDFQKLLIKKNHQNGKYKPRAAICSFILLKHILFPAITNMKGQIKYLLHGEEEEES